MLHGAGNLPVFTQQWTHVLHIYIYANIPCMEHIGTPNYFGKFVYETVFCHLEGNSWNQTELKRLGNPQTEDVGNPGDMRWIISFIQSWNHGSILFILFSGLIYDQTLLKMVFMECWWVTYPPVIKDGWLGNVINGHVNSNIIGLQGIFRKSLFDCQRIVTLWRLSSFAILIEEDTILHMNVW
jgi:hypothetical protein